MSSKNIHMHCRAVYNSALQVPVLGGSCPLFRVGEQRNVQIAILNQTNVGPLTQAFCFQQGWACPQGWVRQLPQRVEQWGTPASVSPYGPSSLDSKQKREKVVKRNVYLLHTFSSTMFPSLFSNPGSRRGSNVPPQMLEGLGPILVICQILLEASNHDEEVMFFPVICSHNIQKTSCLLRTWRSHLAIIVSHQQNHPIFLIIFEHKSTKLMAPFRRGEFQVLHLPRCSRKGVFYCLYPFNQSESSRICRSLLNL